MNNIVLATKALTRRAIGHVPQAVSVDGSPAGYENLLIFAKLYDLPRRDREALECMGPTADGARLILLKYYEPHRINHRGHSRPRQGHPRGG
jgi:hypothetical protein